MIPSIVTAAASSSGRDNPLRVGLLPGSLLHSSLLCCYRTHIGGHNVNTLLSSCISFRLPLSFRCR
uniref:Uncharacterized protein n=1 Tax=Arundo donax TaxID=35708 RepID=A0A0A9AWB2_ARUDO